MDPGFQTFWIETANRYMILRFKASINLNTFFYYVNLVIFLKLLQFSFHKFLLQGKILMWESLW
jgi:hypothetical protein